MQRDTADTSIKKGSLTDIVIGKTIEIHSIIGPGLLESAYEECLCRELEESGIKYGRQKALPLVYKGRKLNCGYRPGIVVEESLILEIKAVDMLRPIHEGQLLTCC